jgi:hypothetical protein
MKNELTIGVVLAALVPGPHMCGRCIMARDVFGHFFSGSCVAGRKLMGAGVSFALDEARYPACPFARFGRIWKV